jgi:hypothetical protein
MTAAELQKEGARGGKTLKLECGIHLEEKT